MRHGRCQIWERSNILKQVKIIIKLSINLSWCGLEPSGALLRAFLLPFWVLAIQSTFCLVFQPLPLIYHPFLHLIFANFSYSFIPTFPSPFFTLSESLSSSPPPKPASRLSLLSSVGNFRSSCWEQISVLITLCERVELYPPKSIWRDLLYCAAAAFPSSSYQK